MGNTSKNKTQDIKAAVQDLLPQMLQLKDLYSEFLESEKQKVLDSVSNLESLLSIEFSDDINDSSVSTEILTIAYGKDSEVIEEELNDN